MLLAIPLAIGATSSTASPTSSAASRAAPSQLSVLLISQGSALAVLIVLVVGHRSRPAER